MDRPAKMPVLLTVGKMEHYEQKEVQRVAADGVIVKPFEATDLLATIQKATQRGGTRRTRRVRSRCR